MNEGTLALLIPIFSVIGGIAIVIVAIITDYRKKTQMIEKGMEIPIKKPTPYGGIKFGALIIGAAIGLTFGSIADNWGLFVEDETGYFVGVMLFAGIGLILSSLYIKNEIKKEEGQ